MKENLIELMIFHEQISDSAVRKMIRHQHICFGGNRNLKIYGTLHCSSGKRLKKENRIFFSSEKEAIKNGYRPCGHCMKQAYKRFKMDLFSEHTNQQTNLLPADGTVNYYGKLMTTAQANHYFDALFHNIEWKNDEAIIFGKRIITKRKVAWYGERLFEYTYSKITKLALPWTKELIALKSLMEEKTGETFNSCLLNLYHTGEEGMAWHSDGEKDLKKNGAIGSLSFGAERKFAFKHKQTKETVSLMLQHGSLLVMKDETQQHWLHRLPPTKTVSKPRINLTFRTIVT